MSTMNCPTPTHDKPLRTGRGAMFWTGWVISILPVLMLAFSASMKFKMPKEAVEGFEHLGWPTQLATGLGILELTCAVIFLIPQTAVLGAILITGYLGGAVATHVRAGDGFGQFIIPAVLGTLPWIGLLLRDARLRPLLPLRR